MQRTIICYEITPPHLISPKRLWSASDRNEHKGQNITRVAWVNQCQHHCTDVAVTTQAATAQNKPLHRITCRKMCTGSICSSAHVLTKSHLNIHVHRSVRPWLHHERARQAPREPPRLHIFPPRLHIFPLSFRRPREVPALSAVQWIRSALVNQRKHSYTWGDKVRNCL